MCDAAPQVLRLLTDNQTLQCTEAKHFVNQESEEIHDTCIIHEIEIHILPLLH